MYAKRISLSAPVAAALLALISALLFAGVASAEPRPGEDHGVRGGVLGVPVLPGEEPAEEPPAPEEEQQVAAQEEETVPAARREKDRPPSSNRLELTIPKLGLKDVSLGSSPDQGVLDREGIMHFGGTDFPWQDESNTYIVGHAIGYAGGRNPEVFRRLANLGEGDRVTLRDADGEKYRYRVYERLVVDPTDYWVTEPVQGKDNIVSLQTCYPEPTFEKRLIVRAELIDEDKRLSTVSDG